MRFTSFLILLISLLLPADDYYAQNPYPRVPKKAIGVIKASESNANVLLCKRQGFRKHQLYIAAYDTNMKLRSKYILEAPPNRKWITARVSPYLVIDGNLWWFQKMVNRDSTTIDMTLYRCNAMGKLVSKPLRIGSLHAIEWWGAKMSSGFEIICSEDTGRIAVIIKDDITSANYKFKCLVVDRNQNVQYKRTLVFPWDTLQNFSLLNTVLSEDGKFAFFVKTADERNFLYYYDPVADTLIGKEMFVSKSDVVNTARISFDSPRNRLVGVGFLEKLNSDDSKSGWKKLCTFSFNMIDHTKIENYCKIPRDFILAYSGVVGDEIITEFNLDAFTVFSNGEMMLLGEDIGGESTSRVLNNSLTITYVFPKVNIVSLVFSPDGEILNWTLVKRHPANVVAHQFVVDKKNNKIISIANNLCLSEKVTWLKDESRQGNTIFARDQKWYMIEFGLSGSSITSVAITDKKRFNPFKLNHIQDRSWFITSEDLGGGGDKFIRLDF